MRNHKTLTEPVPHYRYIAHFEYDEEYRMYTVTVPALPGLVTQGETLEEARFMVRDAIRGYIELLRDRNEPIPSENSPDNLVEAVDVEATKVTVYA